MNFKNFSNPCYCNFMVDEWILRFLRPIVWYSPISNCFLFDSRNFPEGVKLGLSCSNCAEIGGVEMAVQDATENGVERQSGASMMEQLMPEITAQALSYLDYRSLCRLSMTNSHMRKAANDDNAWKALYRKDFTSEQDNVTPPNGWKAYYAATRAVVTTNAEIFRIVRERLVQGMRQFWLHDDGDSFSGYNAVLGSWQMLLGREDVAAFQIQDVRVRVMSNVAWMTMKVYPEIVPALFNTTYMNCTMEDGTWCTTARSLCGLEEVGMAMGNHLCMCKG